MPTHFHVTLPPLVTFSFLGWKKKSPTVTVFLADDVDRGGVGDVGELAGLDALDGAGLGGGGDGEVMEGVGG